jgi:phosphoribosyl 1,2-cyclic phosphodiesterase
MLRFRVLGSGSSGNTTLVEGDGTRILIDAGLAPRELAERLSAVGVEADSIAAVFVSHEHQDHSRGAAGFSKKWGVRLGGSRGTYAAAGLGAAEIEGYDVLEPGVPRQVGSLTVEGVAVPHDAAAPLAFVVSCNGQSLGHATDFGHMGRGLVTAFRRCDAVLVESNYDPDMLRDGPYPWSVKQRILSGFGHLSNVETSRYLARDLGEACRVVVLAHLSRQNNHPEVALMAAEAALRRRGRTEVRLEVTGPEGTDWIEVAPTPPPPAASAPKQLRLF